MSGVAFTLDGQAITAGADETIWQVAQRLGKIGRASCRERV